MIGQDWKFHHCGLIVRDTYKACDHYRMLGFEITDGPYETPQKYADNPMNSIVAWARKDTLAIEMLQPLSGTWVNKAFLENVGEGINHLCFKVADLAAERRAMEEQGFPVVYGFSVPKGQFAYFDTRRNGNLMIELLQPA